METLELNRTAAELAQTTAFESQPFNAELFVKFDEVVRGIDTAYDAHTPQEQANLHGTPGRKESGQGDSSRRRSM